MNYGQYRPLAGAFAMTCLLYTSDAADERSSVDLGGRRIIKKKTKGDHGGGRLIQRIEKQTSSEDTCDLTTT